MRSASFFSSESDNHSVKKVLCQAATSWSIITVCKRSGRLRSYRPKEWFHRPATMSLCIRSADIHLNLLFRVALYRHRAFDLFDIDLQPFNQLVNTFHQPAALPALAQFRKGGDQFHAPFRVVVRSSNFSWEMRSQRAFSSQTAHVPHLQLRGLGALWPTATSSNAGSPRCARY
jgi:hypothetical protein